MSEIPLSKRQVQHLLRLLAHEGKAFPSGKGPGTPWKLAVYITNKPPSE
jgi:hypothetical protein